MVLSDSMITAPAPITPLGALPSQAAIFAVGFIVVVPQSFVIVLIETCGGLATVMVSVCVLVPHWFVTVKVIS